MSWCYTRGPSDGTGVTPVHVRNSELSQDIWILPVLPPTLFINMGFGFVFFKETILGRCNYCEMQQEVSRLHHHTDGPGDETG